MKKNNDATWLVSLVTAICLLGPCFGLNLTGCVRTEATSVEEHEPLWSWDGCDEWCDGAAEDLWAVAYEIQDCPVLMDTISKNPRWKKLYDHFDNYDCIRCGGILCLELSRLDIWDDTLGEIPESDDIKDNLLYLLAGDHIYDCK